MFIRNYFQIPSCAISDKSDLRVRVRCRDHISSRPSTRVKGFLRRVLF